MRRLSAMIARWLPGTGRHARVLTAGPPPVSPWALSLRGPTQDDAREFFARQAASPVPTRFLHHKRRTLYIAAHGLDLRRLGLLPEPPPARAEVCCVCGRTTAVPVEIRDVRGPDGRPHTLYACPHHIDARLTGPGSDEHPYGLSA
ncbi:hypothetical protein AB0G74_04065 [Streptomyces sp. NPDC020875]|uniref:hypothetical protein n=1 Tax=Streptomyces sp. NPDC020875 TaxID=3154898 RepID=UPI0033C65A3B